MDQLVDILTDLDDLYAKAEPAERRILSQALFKRIVIDDDEQVTYVPTDTVSGVFAHLNAEVPDDLTPETNLPRDHAGQVSNFSTYVAGGGPNRNSQRRLDRLVSAWEQGDRGGSHESSVVEEPDPGVLSNPSRRNRTPLTVKEVEAIQTARANGESVLSIAKQFNIHRMTVWEHTKQSGVRPR